MRISNAIERAKAKLDDDPDVRNTRVSSMAPPKNLVGLMDGRKKANSVKFGAERLHS